MHSPMEYWNKAIAAMLSDDITIFCLFSSKYGVNNKSEESLHTFLYLACYHTKSEIVQILLDMGADVNTKGPSLDTPLHIALHTGDVGIAKMLIEHGADVNVQNLHGKTPLAISMRQKMRDISLMLLNLGADPLFGSWGRQTCFDSGLEAENKEVMIVILRKLLRTYNDTECLEMVLSQVNKYIGMNYTKRVLHLVQLARDGA